ncbi:MAG TPA: hypothetical protein VK088_09365 [Acidimicrobiia bacterium]|nr:hypothetical protein [Acidimicrobiia bacterium]
MTTRQPPTTATEAPSSVALTTTEVASRPSAGMKARMWIGQNPVPYVVGCLLGGYWLGRSMGRS